MGPASDLPSLQHALALRARGSAASAQPPPPAAILDSWVRCMQQGLDCTASLKIGVVPGSELAWRRERAAPVRRLAQAELQSVAQQIAGSNFLLAFADAQGVLLEVLADNRFRMSDAKATIVPGSMWNETLCGTNGLGTALSTGAAVSVTGPEHFFLQLSGISCNAAPVRDAHGELVGVIDASSYFASRQTHTLALVRMAAAHIEAGLFLQQMGDAHVVSLHRQPLLLDTPWAGLLAFDDGGCLLAASSTAGQMLGPLAPGQSCEALLGQPWPTLVQRLLAPQALPLSTPAGMALAARMRRWAPAAYATPMAQVTDAAHAGGPPGASQEAGLRAPLAPPSPARLGALAAGGTAAGALAMPKPASPAAFAGEDAAVREAWQTLSAALRMGVAVLIQGETGTGKELLARRAHALSGRSGAFVAVNCAALPAELFEAEFFGYLGGAFTGARREGSAGLAASADGGTLLLDEIGELSATTQAALLRFLDDRMVRPLGGTRSRPIDVQLLAATHVDLALAVAQRRFREDLYHRLNIVSVRLPALHERRDFAACARQVLAELAPDTGLDEGALQALAAAHWAGNFRELRAALTRSLLHARAADPQIRVLGLAQVQPWLPPAARPDSVDGLAFGAGLAHRADSARPGLQLKVDELIRQTFEHCGRSVSRTARELGVSRNTVYRHLREGPTGASVRP